MKNKETILALDIGTKLGVFSDTDINGFMINLGKGDDRYGKFYDILEHRLSENFYDRVVYEAAAFQIGNAIPVYHGLIGVLKAACSHYAIPLTGIPVKTIKKVFTGSGNATKKDIMKRCDELGLKYSDDNAADAIAVYHTYFILKKD